MTVTTNDTFTIHWGRTLVALVGLLALLTAPVTGVLAAAGPLAAAVPLTALGVFVLSLAVLRSMAVVRRRRRRRERIDAAMREAMYPQPEAAGQPAAASGAAAPFDALSSDERGVGGPNSLAGSASRSSLNRLGEESELSSRSAQSSTQQVDEDGLPVEVERTFSATADQQTSDQPVPDQQTSAAAAHAQHAQSAQGTQGRWEPREVPRPKYLEAEKAERAMPEPLAPEEPKRPAAEVRLSPGAQAAPPQPDAQRKAAEKPSAKNRSMDLDEVLKRRRA